MQTLFQRPLTFHVREHVCTISTASGCKSGAHFTAVHVPKLAQDAHKSHRSRQPAPAHTTQRGKVRVCASPQPQPSQQQTIELPSLTEITPVAVAEELPATPGVYAVYDSTGQMQYIGLSRKVSASVATHVRDVPELVHEVKFASIPSASKEILTAAWQAWVQETVNLTGTVPPGNQKGNDNFSVKPKRAKPEIKLTPGKGAQDVTVPITDLISAVVNSNKVVAFVKGTRTEPQCGFSHKVLTLLNDVRTDYEVVNVLDDVYNPGLREAIKTFSQWPTIPQVYIKGEFVGGADVLEEMHQSGELKKAIST